MADEVKMPVSFGVSTEAMARGKAAADPNLYPPENARTDKDKDGKVHSRWVESGTVDMVWQESTKGGENKPKLAVFVVGVRFRPGEPNQNKVGFFRLMLHPDIASGKPVSATVRASYEQMTERNLGALISLLEVAGKLPKSGGMPADFLAFQFPHLDPKTKKPMTKSPLLGTAVSVKIHQQPNEGGTRDKQDQAELFMVAKPLAEAEKTPF